MVIEDLLLLLAVGEKNLVLSDILVLQLGKCAVAKGEDSCSCIPGPCLAIDPQALPRPEVRITTGSFGILWSHSMPQSAAACMPQHAGRDGGPSRSYPFKTGY